MIIGLDFFELIQQGVEILSFRGKIRNEGRNSTYVFITALKKQIKF